MKFNIKKLFVAGLFAAGTLIIFNTGKNNVSAVKQNIYQCSITYFPDGSSVAQCYGAGSDCEVISDCSNCW